MEFILLAAALVFPHDPIMREKYIEQQVCINETYHKFEFKQALINFVDFEKMHDHFEDTKIAVCGPEIKAE